MFAQLTSVKANTKEHNMHKIQLPAEVNEDNIFQFLVKLGSGNEHNEISLDFKKMTHYTPDAIIAIVSKIRQWKSLKKKVRIKNQKQCNAYKFLVRINFFAQCGIKHKGASDAIKEKNTQACIFDIEDITLLAKNIAYTIAPNMKDPDSQHDDTGLFNCVEYIVSELCKNVEQHSNTAGIVTAHYFASTDYVRIAVADSGVGIKKSLDNIGMEHQSDIEAIEKALDNNTTLSKLHTLASKLGGQFIVVSNQGFVTLDETNEFVKNREFTGTLCSFSFKRSEVKSL